MFKIESYVTPILLSYVDKYVKDFKPADAQVSLWGGGVALHNLVLKADVLQQEVSLPFTLVSGRIHELLIQVPWTKIMSEPIIVTIDTIECVLNLKPPVSEDSPPPVTPSRKTQVVEAPPGYMQALVRRIVSNIALRVHHLIVKYVQDDIVMSLNVKHVSVDSAGIDWEPAFADIDQSVPLIRRLVQLDDFTLCLDKADSDGKIRFYQEPLLYRCQLDLRVLTHLVSANTRRASNFSLQLRSSKLAWSVTSEQLTLLLRLVQERPHEPSKPQPAAPKQTAMQMPSQSTSSIKSLAAEPTRSSSWSEWAWSWLPSWTDKEGGTNDVPAAPTSLPLYFSAYLDDVSLVFKIAEMESQNRKRFRSVLEVGATHAALKSAACFPTSMRIRCGARDIELRSYGKCVCGFPNYDALYGRPTIFMKRTEIIDADWKWPVESSAGFCPVVAKPDAQTTAEENIASQEESSSKSYDRAISEQESKELTEETDELWAKMSPVILMEYSHVRSPPDPFTNPYDNPPKDFQYSDWVEECHARVRLDPIELRVCMGLVHRLTVLYSLFKEIQREPKPAELKRVLTVEECDSLNDNMPERRFSVDASKLRIRIVPWNHSGTLQAPLVQFCILPKISVSVNGPLYPHRICSAACQMPDYGGHLWQACRLNISAVVHRVQLVISTLEGDIQKTCARADVHLVMHILHHKSYFTKKECVEMSYSAKITEMNICGSAARLEAAAEVVLSLIKDHPSIVLRYSSLPKDAFHDEDAVAIDFTLEELVMRGYRTSNVNTHIITLQAAKATLFHEPTPGDVKQAWLLSAPDAPTSCPYFRLAVQWCDQVTPTSFDYLGMWSEPTAISIDPLFVAWLAYKPVPSFVPIEASSSSQPCGRNMQSQYLFRKKTPPSSSSTRATSLTASGAELVHMRSRTSIPSSSEPSERREPVKEPQKSELWWRGEKLVALHERFRGILMNVEVGLMQVYVTMSTASAVDCVTLRDAMERHAISAHRVVALSLGRIVASSNTANTYLWQELRHDGPTFLTEKPTAESFPWKIRLADVSCYTLETHVERLGGHNATTSTLRSTIKNQPGFAHTHTVLELVTTTITVSVVTKNIQIKTISVAAPHRKEPQSVPPETTRYFTAGMEFKPTTLQEFFRGPMRKIKKVKKEEPKAEEKKTPNEEVKVTSGPMVSLGVHLHADTPPIIIRLEDDQVHVVAVAIHCLNHIVILLKRDPFTIPKQRQYPTSPSQKSVVRSVSEVEEPQSGEEDIPSHSSEVIDIFVPSKENAAMRKLTTFFWFQWVVSHATLVVASRTVKLVFDVDDIISTVDIQSHYNQFKIKVASASVRQYERVSSTEWIPGVLGGRVLEAREHTGTKDEDQFLAVTITQAQISNLPPSWKQELHPKLLERSDGEDSMWEIYATLAPLEMIIQPVILDNVASLVAEMMPRALCPLKIELKERAAHWQWPFCYMTAGGLRVLITGEEVSHDGTDDSMIFNIDRIMVNPHPDNPVCRRSVNASVDGGWAGTVTNYEGRQYELNIKNFGIRTAQFEQLIHQESEQNQKGTNENPAFKWSQQIIQPVLTTLLHTVDICCVVAPAMYTNGVLSCGPAVEVNLITDCYIELSIHQAVLMQTLVHEIHTGLCRRNSLLDFGRLKFDKHGTCPYAGVIDLTGADNQPYSDTAFLQGQSSNDTGRSMAEDSGVDTLGSQSTSKGRATSDDVPLKKCVSIMRLEHIADPAEYLEIFVTMGTIEISLCVQDDSSPEVIALRPPRTTFFPAPSAPQQERTKVENKPRVPTGKVKRENQSLTSTKSISEHARDANNLQGRVEIEHSIARPAVNPANVHLLHVTLQQPNLYYWRKKGQKSIQLSLFDAAIGLGQVPTPGKWCQMLLTTAKGETDPVTEIPPALATMKIVAPVLNSEFVNVNFRGTIRLDVERPVQLDVCEDRIRRLMGIYALLRYNLTKCSELSNPTLQKETPILYKLRHKFLQEGIESVTVNTSQVGMCGWAGTAGWDSLQCQMAAGARPERLSARALLTAFVLTTGPPNDRRHVILQPLMMGIHMEASWEAWRRAEGGPSTCDPSLRLGIEIDRIVIDLRPTELQCFSKLHTIAKELMPKKRQKHVVHADDADSVNINNAPWRNTSFEMHQGLSSMYTDTDTDSDSHYYKDDLRSGAFKILKSAQLPMAYQVMLHDRSVSWRYPHPRAITRIVAFPLPGEDTEIDCVLELFTPILDLWEPHTYFKIPVGEPREISLYLPAPDAVFATMWRFRACHREKRPPEFEFIIDKFKPKAEPLLLGRNVEDSGSKTRDSSMAEQMSGVLRVDSYFAPQLLPRTKIMVRMGETELHIHNSLPFLSSKATALEGYYVSRPLMRSHRVLSLSAMNTKMHAQLDSPAGVLYIIDTNISADIMDCATGTMERLVKEFTIQAGVSARPGMNARTRVATGVIQMALHVPRIRTLHALRADWTDCFEKCYRVTSVQSQASSIDALKEGEVESAEDTTAALEGRVSLWVRNSCASALRVGQEATDEVVPLGPGATLAYRWRSPTAPKKLRLALADPSANWHWSTSLPFTAGTMRVRLEDPVNMDKKSFRSPGLYVHVKVEELGAKRIMTLFGRLSLANMLRFNLFYKVRSNCGEPGHWRTVCSGEMNDESVGYSVICNADADMVLKIKLMTHNTGWSGDIPLRECPKENVPWLVKVPSEGDMSYISVWCRVVRARNDGRILATVWPLYVLHSHLPLDTDVLIVTEKTTSKAELETLASPPPLIQSTPGRGCSTHILAPGTTANRHNLSFQYRNIESPVTREAVPMHYGVTDTSVFDKRTPVTHIDEVLQEIMAWLERSGRNAHSAWPYSIVSKHWNTPWRAALLQPRCDVAVRYQAVRVGGGCSLEIQLCPIVLLCNAAPIALTLRAHDAAPLCKLESGSAISPSSAILKKPFFISVEVGRETFVSERLQVSSAEPGRYGSLPPGHVALDHATRLSILCNQKVALLTMYYEIKQEINVIGITSTFVLINRLDTKLLVSPIAVPDDGNDHHSLRAKTFKLVHPTKPGSINGTALCRFWLFGRWRGGDPSELRTFLCLALPSHVYPTYPPVPVRLGELPVRRAISLVDRDNVSIPVIVTQIKHDSRWLVVVARDPCPQFVVLNETRMAMHVAQPLPVTHDQPSTSQVSVKQECTGARWWCLVRPGALIHYSTPSHCLRFPCAPPPAAVPPNDSVTLLTFGRSMDEGQIEWSSPVASADGEQLLQFYGGITVKLGVTSHPHSTLLVLKDTDQHDISASDIRRRLHGAMTSENARTQVSEPSLSRTGATSHIFGDAGKNVSIQQSETSITTAPSIQDRRELVSVRNDSNVMFSESVRRHDTKRDSDFHLHFRKLDRSDLNLSQPMLPLRKPSSDYPGPSWSETERLRFMAAGLAVEMATTADEPPLFALHLDRTALLIQSDVKNLKLTLSIADVQIDNLQYDTGQYDFAVIASTRAEPLEADQLPSLWNIFGASEAFDTKEEEAKLMLKLHYDLWNILSYSYKELTELEVRIGSLALYVEDAYVTALIALSRLVWPSTTTSMVAVVLAEERALQNPLRLRLMYIHPLDLTLTLHTAVRMYIALDQSPLRLSAFKLHDMMTSADRLTHALTVHYLSAAILGAGWVVGGLELLGAPGALAARLGGATGGVKGVASATAAALVRSLSAWAGSLARNLDLLAGDEEHARRAAAARRRPPPSFVAGLMAGVTNFAINILGAVGGLAHHPLVGVAVGETESSAAGLRRGLLGALTKPLSATADLVAYAGHGLLRQTGWDPVPKPRSTWLCAEIYSTSGWQRDCVRWAFRLADLNALAGFEVLLDHAPLLLLITHKFLVVADPETERVVEMINFKFCTLAPYQGQIIELRVSQRKITKQQPESTGNDDEDEYQISTAAMARVARYTGAAGAPSQSEVRILSLLPMPGKSHCLYATLAALLHNNVDSHLSLL